MARRSAVPKLYRHTSGRGFVRVNGRDTYLGKYGTPACNKAYAAFIAELASNGGNRPVAHDELTIVELCDQFTNYAESLYVDADGKKTTTIERIRPVVAALREFYEETPACEFGPKRLRALRQRWIDDGLARTTINDYLSEVKRMFKWACSHELLPVTVHQALQTVDGLRRGRSGAKETERIRPVPQAHIDAVKKHAPRQIAALIELQLLTGARPGELVRLRPIDLDTSGKIWSAKIEDHKNKWRGHDRFLYFGERAKRILKDFIVDRALDAHLFSPREAERDRYARQSKEGKKRPRRENQKPNPRKTERTLYEFYSVDTYRKCIAVAVRKANKNRDDAKATD